MSENSNDANARLLTAGAGFRTAREKPKDDADEDSCPAFGFLRGVRERALALELRLANGNRHWLPYALLGPWSYNPSTGLVLRYTGESTTLVHIHGSNLDAPVSGGTANLLDSGLQRHRVTWIREMSADECTRAGPAEPTVDRIDLGDADASESSGVSAGSRVQRG